MDKPISIRELLSDTWCNYNVPLYQRNFSWEYPEIDQLITDIFDSMKDDRDKYYIGTLVVFKNDAGKFDIIDGQQRFTAVLLICLYIQNWRKGSDIKKINLSFEARDKSNNTLTRLLKNENEQDKNEIKTDELLNGYNIIASSLKDRFEDEDYDLFYKYFLDKVYIFINEMPQDTNVNLYFERFNSRGEQLEAHEVIKTELMQKLLSQDCDAITIKKFAKIWEVCSEFETPCINFFKKKTKAVDADNEREKIFNCKRMEYEPAQNTWLYQYDLKNVYEYVIVNEENKQSIFSALSSKEKIELKNDNESCLEEFDKYRCIINFNTFLYYVLYITNGETNGGQYDDKKLKESFNVAKHDKEWILRFGENLLKTKFIFDNLIIRDSIKTTARQNEDEWFLQKAYREDKNEKKYGHLYAQTRFDKNSFSMLNKEILTLQSMLAVTFTAYKDTKWLFSTLSFLYDNASKINGDNFGKEFHDFLEMLTKEYAKGRFCSETDVDKSKLRYNNHVPVYAFNLMDYVIWKNRDEMKKQYTKIKFDEFKFTYRRSIEHWYPQNSNKNEGHEAMVEALLHSFGNLCVIVASQNSAFGNLDPPAKLLQWKTIFSSQSLKLQMMAKKTAMWGQCWDESKKREIEEMEDELVKMLREYVFG